jgi:excisionase family DNA binding protein
MSTPVELAEARWLDYRRAAKYSALSAATLRRMVEGGKLRAYRPHGRRVVLDRVELDEVIRRGVVGRR